MLNTSKYRSSITGRRSLGLVTSTATLLLNKSRAMVRRCFIIFTTLAELGDFLLSFVRVVCILVRDLLLERVGDVSPPRGAR